MTDKLHNDIHRPLNVPGFNGLPIYLRVRDEEPSFAYADEGYETHDLPLTARELVMLQVMNNITDESDWYLNLFDNEKVNGWREEALKIPLMSSRAWDWCLSELKDKAKDYKTTSYVVTLNGRSGICKSDVAVFTQLQAELKDGIVDLLASADIEKNGSCNAESNLSLRARKMAPCGRVTPRGRGGIAPNDGDLSGIPWRSQVVSHIDPLLYPLVYGKTRVMSDGGGPTSLSNCLEYSGCGRAPTFDKDAVDQQTVDRDEKSRTVRPFWNSKYQDLTLFSARFQRLPCEVQFTESKEVEITSYINNLHPARCKSMYTTLDKLISAAIQPWNEVLVKKGCAPLWEMGLPPDEVVVEMHSVPLYRWSPRIRTWGAEWSTKPSDGWPSSEALLELEKDRSSEPFKAMVSRIREYLLLPYDSLRVQRLGLPCRYMDTLKSDDWERQPGGLELAIRAQWEHIKQWEHPEPGISFTYAQWKAGRSGNAVVSRPLLDKAEWTNDHEYYSVSLMESFRERGLQVIIKMASIELTPVNPLYEDAGWVVDGMANDHIAATAIFYYDTVNVTTPGLSFREVTTMRRPDLDFESGLTDAVAAIFGVSSSEEMAEAFDGLYWTGDGELNAWQTIGTVLTPQGRMVAWPNTIQHKFTPVQLEDKTKPGYARYVVLSLVDPYYRICSTRNVPPQRNDWWYDKAVEAIGLKEKGIPQEIINMIGDRTDGWPMSVEEAEDLREEMVEEFQKSMKHSYGPI